MDMGRILSAIICAICFLLVKQSAGAEGVVNLLWWMPWPMALSWFGDELGSSRGYNLLHPVTMETPGCAARFAGWIGLLIILGVILYRGSLLFPG